MDSMILPLRVQPAAKDLVGHAGVDQHPRQHHDAGMPEQEVQRCLGRRRLGPRQLVGQQPGCAQQRIARRQPAPAEQPKGAIMDGAAGAGLAVAPEHGRADPGDAPAALTMPLI
jgi:hypothetical protein